MRLLAPAHCKSRTGIALGATEQCVLGTPRICRDPVHDPGLTAIGGKRLLEHGRILSDVEDDANGARTRTWMSHAPISQSKACASSACCVAVGPALVTKNTTSKRISFSMMSPSSANAPATTQPTRTHLWVRPDRAHGACAKSLARGVRDLRAWPQSVRPLIHTIRAWGRTHLERPRTADRT